VWTDQQIDDIFIGAAKAKAMGISMAKSFNDILAGIDLGGDK